MIPCATRQRFYDWKAAQGCKYCGEKEPLCLELHSLDPNKKDFRPASYSAYSWEKLMEKARQSVVVCKNCHTKIHNNLPV